MSFTHSAEDFTILKYVEYDMSGVVAYYVVFVVSDRVSVGAGLLYGLLMVKSG